MEPTSAMTSSNGVVFIGKIKSKPEQKSSFSILLSQVFLYLIGIENLYDLNMEIKDEIATWVRSARKSAGLSGEALGAKLALELRTARGNTKGNISHWELGKHLPSIAQLVAVSKITGYPLPPSVIDKSDGELQLASGLLDQPSATPGYEFFFSHIVTALREREVPPHIQSTIITLLDTCPIRRK
jgi:transcriptional regulator with XRE-family HTH domain